MCLSNKRLNVTLNYLYIIHNVLSVWTNVAIQHRNSLYCQSHDFGTIRLNNCSAIITFIGCVKVADLETSIYNWAWPWHCTLYANRIIKEIIESNWYENRSIETNACSTHRSKLLNLWDSWKVILTWIEKSTILNAYNWLSSHLITIYTFHSHMILLRHVMENIVIVIHHDEAPNAWQWESLYLRLQVQHWCLV